MSPLDNLAHYQFIGLILLLLHHYRLGEVPGLVNIVAAQNGYVIGEKLQRHYLNNRQQQYRRGGQGDNEGGNLGHRVVTFGGDRQQRNFSGGKFTQIRQAL